MRRHDDAGQVAIEFERRHRRLLCCRRGQEARPDLHRIGHYAATCSGAAIGLAALHARGMSSSSREAGQRLTSLVSTSGVLDLLELQEQLVAMLVRPAAELPPVVG